MLQTTALLRLSALLFLAFGAAGCQGAGPGVFRPLLDAASMKIYALEPTRLPTERADEGFHGFAVLGEAALPDAEKPALLGLLGRGVAENEGVVAACFNPRHGLRARFADGSTRDLVICFECMQIYEYHGAERSASHRTTRSPAAAVSAIFVALGLKIAG